MITNGATVVDTLGMTAISPYVSAIIAKPINWIVLRPIVSMYLIATKYPGSANTTKMPSWISVPWVSDAVGESRPMIVGLAIVLP